jgi:cytochrome d ubiquinol oxidase subunit II
MDFAILWYFVLGLASIAYCILDGFDLGVGALHLFAKNDEQRRVFLNAIGPVWDGNEVWIVIMMGGLFAGFPNAYATIFSGFYTLLMFLIAGLIFRAVAIEFRSKRSSHLWRSFWDVVFSIASILVGLAVGLILGNMIEGVPLNAAQEYVGTFADFFRPYSIVVSLTAMSLFAMHGTIYLTMKTEGEAHQIVRKWVHKAIIVFIFFYILTSIATFLYMPHMIEHIFEMPLTIIFPILAFLAIFNIPRLISKNKDGWAFIFSCLSITFLLILFGLGTYPTIVRSTINPETHSLTIFNVAASNGTLRNLMVVVLIGLPLVLAYGFWIYRIFRGKVVLSKSSY